MEKDNAVTVSIATMSSNTDDSNTMSDANNESGDTLVRDTVKGRCTNRRYCHKTNIDHENELTNKLIKDLVKCSRKRKIYNYSDDSTIETQNKNYLKVTTKN